MSKMIFGYWNIRGIAEPIRYLLYYKNVPFEEKKYERTDETVWRKEKYNLGLDFPNLPYLFDGKVKLSQSTTILRYLAGKYGLDGNTAEDKLRVSLVEQQILDLRRMFFGTVFPADFKKAKKEYFEKATEHFKLLSDFLGKRKYLVGDYITYVDFMAYEILDFNLILSKRSLDDFPSLKAYHQRIQSLPELQAYLNSPNYRKWPLFAPSAAWGGKADEKPPEDD